MYKYAKQEQTIEKTILIGILLKSTYKNGRLLKTGANIACSSSYNENK